MSSLRSLIFLASLVGVLSSGYIAPLDKSLKCRGCDLIGQSLHKEFVKIFENTEGQTYLVGGRMQNNAKKARKKDYYGSEAMAEDVMEGVCARVNDLGEELLEERHSDMSYKEVTRVEESLESYCGMIIEEHEDDIKEHLFDKKLAAKEGFDQLRRWLCVDQEAICDGDYFDQRLKKEAAKEVDKADDSTKASADLSNGLDGLSKLLGQSGEGKDKDMMKEITEKMKDLPEDDQKEINEKSKENTAKNFPTLPESKAYFASEAGQKFKAKGDSDDFDEDGYEDVTSNFQADVNKEAAKATEDAEHLQPNTPTPDEL